MYKPGAVTSDFVIGLHYGDGVGRELVNYCAELIKILTDCSRLSFETVYVPQIYDRATDSLNKDALKAIDEIHDAHGAIITGPIQGEGTYLFRRECDFFYKLVEIRPLPELEDASVLKRPVRDNMDFLLVRHNNGLYTRPHEYWKAENHAVVWGTQYSMQDLRRFATICFLHASNRRKTVNVGLKIREGSLVTQIWETAFREATQAFCDGTFRLTNVDFLAADLFADPRKYDVLAMPDMEGDVLCDPLLALVNGSRNFDPSGNFAEDGFAYYQTCHGSALNIEGRDVANPVAQIRSLGMLLRYSFGLQQESTIIEDSVRKALSNYRTIDGRAEHRRTVGTRRMVECIKREVIKHYCGE